MVQIKSITDAFADVVLMDGRKLHVAAKPSALSLISALAKKAPIESFLDIYAKKNEVPSDAKEKEAIFCLGKKDMQASVCDMLRQLADGAADPVSAGLILAADLVESMEVPDANS